MKNPKKYRAAQKSGVENTAKSALLPLPYCDYLLLFFKLYYIRSRSRFCDVEVCTWSFGSVQNSSLHVHQCDVRAGRCAVNRDEARFDGYAQDHRGFDVVQANLLARGAAGFALAGTARLYDAARTGLCLVRAATRLDRGAAGSRRAAVR